VDSDELPVTVKAAIAARIDAMPTGARSALLGAAVIGKTFWRGPLEAMGAVDDLDEALNVLEGRDLIRRDATSQVADWREGGEPAKAIPYLPAAAAAAQNGWAKDAAVGFYTKALELAEDDELRRRIRMKRAAWRSSPSRTSGVQPTSSPSCFPSSRVSVRPVDHAEALYLYHDTMWWTGSYERAVELASEGRKAAVDVRGAELVIRGGGRQAVALAGLGRHEEAIRIFDEVFAVSRDLGWNPRVLLNYSAMIFRELNDLAEARRRSAEALELSEGIAFSMPRSFAGADLVLTDVLAGHIGAAKAGFETMWRNADKLTAWTRWLIFVWLSAARAEIALEAESPECAVDWARQTVDVAIRTLRRKYEARGRVVLGEALARLGRRDEALAELDSAVRIADELVGQPLRWHAQAALGRAAYALGDDDRAARAYGEALRLVEEFSSALAPERAAQLAKAPLVEEIRSAAR
jgi:tetratricopeptide (TPR) repeat protein